MRTIKILSVILLLLFSTSQVLADDSLDDLLGESVLSDDGPIGAVTDEQSFADFEVTDTAEATSNNDEETVWCVSEAYNGTYNRGWGSGHAMYMPKSQLDGGDLKYNFAFRPDPARFVEHTDGTATMTGQLIWLQTLINKGVPAGDVDYDATRGFEVDVTFTGRTDVRMSGSPKKELSRNAYSNRGGPVNIDTWWYYQDLNGTLTGLPGGIYEGAVIKITRRGPNFQLGMGANGKNINMGAATWLNWKVIQQPTNGPTIPNGKGDFNLDLNPCPEPENSSLGDTVWRDINQDGLQNDGENTGIADVVVNLYKDDGDGVFDEATDTLVDTTTTDSEGYYLFDTLKAGDYFVKVDMSNFEEGSGVLTGFETSPQQVGDDSTIDSDGDVNTHVTPLITLPANTDDMTWDFGFFEKKSTAVDLIRFVGSANDGTVTLTWETGSELDNIGFNLYRSTNADDGFEKVNTADLIGARGSVVSGETYNHEDADLGAGTYFYKLEDVDYNGVSTFHPVITVEVP